MAKGPILGFFQLFFFGDDYYNYDSDGNSIPLYSRNWTELYIQSRFDRKIWFDIDRFEFSNEILEVTANSVENVNIITYFLAKETNGEILDTNNNTIFLETLIKQIGDFDMEEQLIFAELSIWRKSSETNPFPNIL